MRKVLLAAVAVLGFTMTSFAQDGASLEQLRSQKAELAAKAAEAQAAADAIVAQISDVQSQIEVLSGWMTGFSGDVGFGLNKASNYQSLPNPNASSSALGLNLAAFANKMSTKTMFRNKLLASVNWQDVDPAVEAVEDGLFDDENRVGDILNLSSLYGYRIHPKFAISALGELNTAVFNFLQPGSLDIGVGGTWTPNNNLVVVVHPLNYNIAWPVDGDVSSSGALGMKVRADYTNSYNIAGKTIGLSSTLSSFLPYSGDKPFTNLEGEAAGPFQYTWINQVSFTLWKGIGVGVGFTLRDAAFETNEFQTIYNLGLNYTM